MGEHRDKRPLGAMKNMLFRDFDKKRVYIEFRTDNVHHWNWFRLYGFDGYMFKLQPVMSPMQEQPFAYVIYINADDVKLVMDYYDAASLKYGHLEQTFSEPDLPE